MHHEIVRFKAGSAVVELTILPPSISCCGSCVVRVFIAGLTKTTTTTEESLKVPDLSNDQLGYLNLTTHSANFLADPIDMKV